MCPAGRRALRATILAEGGNTGVQPMPPTQTAMFERQLRGNDGAADHDNTDVGRRGLDARGTRGGNDSRGLRGRTDGDDGAFYW